MGVALVTGAGTGIGAAIAKRLARDGWLVGVNARGPGEADETVGAVTAAGGSAIALIGDVSREDDVRRIVDECVFDLGGLHVAVNNAAVQEHRPFLDLDLATWRSTLDVDLTGVFLVSLYAARRMAATGGGTIVNISSVHEHVPRAGAAPYCVSKAGVGMLTKCLALELAGKGVRAVAVAPGAIRTDGNARRLADPEQRELLLSDIPVGRTGEPEEIADVVAFLASPGAAYVTGTTVVVDGGLEQRVVTH